jgi:hypothetical protein
MEENTVELFDYFRVVWKRKILIIVVTLVCLGIGVGVLVMNSRSKLPPVTLYQADVVVKIGQKLLFTPSSGISTSIVYIEPPEYLVVTLPIKHGFKVKDTLGYHLDVKRIGATSMLKLTLKGPDIGVERVLMEIVDMLADEHGRKKEVSVAAYTSFIKKLEADANMIQENIDVAEESIKEIKRRGGMHLEEMVASEAKIKEDKSGGGQSAFMNMLYLKAVDLERDLRESRNDLRNTQWQLILYKTSIGDRKKYNTEMIGKVKSTAVTPKEKKKSTMHMIIVAGVAGLIMSLFIAFFSEYLEESKSRSKRKGK